MIHFTVHTARKLYVVEMPDTTREIPLPTGHTIPADMIGTVHLTPSGMPAGVMLTPMGLPTAPKAVKVRKREAELFA